MTNKKQINLYSSYPVLDYASYFSEKAVKPLIYKPKLDNDTLLPSKQGISKRFLLEVEHELSLKNEIHIFGWFINNKEHSLIYDIAEKYNADIHFYYLEKSLEELFDSYKEQGGILNYQDFINLYSHSFDFPERGVTKIFLERL